MGIVFRQSVKTTIIAFSGALLGALINYVYTFILTKPQLGYSKDLIYQGAVLQVFVLLGVNSTVATFIPRYSHNKQKSLLTISVFVPLIVTVLLSVPYVIFRSKILSFFQVEDAVFINTFYLWLPLLILLWSYMSLFELYLISQVKVAIPTFMREIVLRLLNIVLIILFAFKLISFYYFIIGTILVYAVPPLALLLVSLKTDSFGFSFNWKIFSKEEFKEIFRFSWYHLLLGATINLLGYIDSLMLGSMDKKGFSSLAVYSQALLIISIMLIPYRAMTLATFPILNKAYIDNDKKKVRDLFHRSSINILIVAIAMFLIIICNLDNVVTIFPKGYEAIKPIVVILMIGRMIDMATGLNTELTSITMYYKVTFRLSVILLVMLVIFNRIFIPEYGIYGAAWASTLALAFFNLAKMIFLWKKLGIQPFTTKSIIVIFAGLIAGIAGYYFPTIIHATSDASRSTIIICTIADAIMRTIIIIISYSILLLLLKPSPDLNEYLQTVRAKKRLF